MKSEKKLSENLRTKIRLVLTMLCAVGMILGTVPSTAKAAPGKYMHMHGGAGLTFHFVFQTVSPGDIESIDVPGMDNESGAVPAVYQETGHEIETGDKLLYVKVFDSSGELVGIIQQNAIHERGTGQAEYVMLDDGTMGAPADHGGLIEFNDGTANFWYQGFDVADAAHLTPLKVWEDSEGNPVTDPPTPFNFTLTFYPIPGNVQQVTVAPGKQIGLSKGTYEVSEPDVDGFELKSIVWNTSVGTSTDILGLAARVVAGHADYTVTFTNVESTSPYIQLTIPAQKIADFGVLKDGQFHFAVIDEDDDIVAQATNDAAGNITFKLPRYYAEELDIGDTILNFTVVETSVSKGGWTVGGETYKVAFTITNTSIDETPTATGPVVTDSNGVAVDAITFTNTYAAKGQLSLEATKNANVSLSGGEFEFELLDANDGSVVATATNDASGNISFPAIDYELNKDIDDTGDYFFKVVETPTTLPHWTSDPTEFNIKVTVTDNGFGKLDTVVTDAETGEPVDISFTNTYVAPHTEPVTPKPVPLDTPKLPPLPPTVDGTMFPMAGILGLLMTATVLVALRRRSDLMFGSE